jgi:acyl-CoA hydrolase
MTRTRIDEGWRQRCGGRLCSPEDAVGLVEDGHTVYMGGWTSSPPVLSQALFERRGTLRDVTLLTFLTPFDWNDPAARESFQLSVSYAGPFERPGIAAGYYDYVPIAQWRAGRLPPGLDRDIDVAMIPISPPDSQGICSFGGGVWFGPSVSQRARILVGEIHPEFIRTGGQNSIPISRFTRVCEATATPAGPPTLPPRSEETELAAQVICSLVAGEIIHDGATLQIGVGDVSTALLGFLGDKHDLGIHSEIVPGGLTDLVRAGVVTGKKKALHPDKVVASALTLMSPEELDFIDGNPMFELYDFSYTDDLRNILQLENFVAVNNALAVDLTGNVCSETRGTRVFSGPGGQPAFAVGASTAAGGSVIVLPSSQLLPSGRVPRIVAQHEAGSTVTVHRGFVDFVVTEQGIARLRGKSIRQRIDELIGVAHPDFRSELRSDAKRLYSV